MLETVLFYVHSGILLLFGVCLSLAFAGVQASWRNVWTGLGVSVMCGALQLGALLLFSEVWVWKLYPLLTHIPIALVICLVYHKHILTAVAAVCTAYMYCQPANWAGVIAALFADSGIVQYTVAILTLGIVTAVTLKFLAGLLAELYNKDLRNVCIFAIVPTVYYAFDYTTAVYTDLWMNNNQAVKEFLPFFLSVVFMVFCLVYHKEYVQKSDAEKKEQMIRLAVSQQAKEINAAKQSEKEARMLRHDMRFFLGGISACISSGEYGRAQEMIEAYTTRIDATKLQHFCQNDTVNFVLSDFAAKCTAKNIPFHHTVHLSQLKVDELLFASILANALDNALNAQDLLPEGERRIKVMLKDSDDKLLLSVKNPMAKIPVFSDGVPVAGRNGHGYGTQSILYTTKQLGGNCQFSVQDNQFIVRVIL